jgi:hypothetical protein
MKRLLFLLLLCPSLAFAQAAGGGDVSGPTSATNENIAVFDGTTGALIKDGGMKIADLAGDACFEADGDNLMPISGDCSADTYFETDVNSDIMPKT